MRDVARRASPAIVVAILFAACSSDDDEAASTADAETTDPVTATSALSNSTPSTRVAATGDPATSTSGADDATASSPSTTADDATSSPPPTTADDATSSPPPTTADPDATTFPGARWERQPAADLGFDQQALDVIAEDAESAGSTCLLVVRHGRIAAEWNWGDLAPTKPREIFSASKSVTSSLVGIAADDGALSIDESAAKYIPEWRGTPSEAVTVEDLLSNDSGREWSVEIDYSQLITSPDRSQFSIDLGQDAPPGTVWAYNNSAIQTLSEVLQSATGEEPADFAADRLFAPIGMRRSHMTKDGAGNTNTFFGVQSTCRDLARFGLLFLNGGMWDGTEIVPAAYVEASIGSPSTDLISSYGYLWWLNRKGRLANPAVASRGTDSPGGQMASRAPADMYWALGLLNQIVQVDPGSDTVVVRLGAAPPEGVAPFDQTATARVVTDAMR